MLGYWLLFAIAAIPGMLPARPRARSLPPWVMVGLIFVIAIGFRDRVGGDWWNYLGQFHRAAGAPMSEAITDPRVEPGYGLLQWVMGYLDWGIYGVNTVCGAIFVSGLAAFCRRQPAPWLGFAVAVPYLVIVMAMGYTRQSVALGFFFLGLAAIGQGRFLHYVFWLALAATFHKSAVLLIPLGMFIYGKGWAWRTLAIATAAYGLWDLLLADHQERLWAAYVDAQMESQGAKIRVLMNLAPSVLLLLYAKRWRRLFPDFAIWLWLAVASVAAVVLVDFATTAVDRVSLYFSAIQVAVFARLPVLMLRQLHPELIRLGLITGYGAVLFVWLNYAVHAQYWLPYRNILLE